MGRRFNVLSTIAIAIGLKAEAFCPRRVQHATRVTASSATTGGHIEVGREASSEGAAIAIEESFDRVVNDRYACTRFRRYQEPSLNNTEALTASVSDPAVVSRALQCVGLAQRSPSGFNEQPFRIILVSSEQAKQKLASCCIGRNAYRVRDSDCSAVFLADRESGRNGKRYKEMLLANMISSEDNHRVAGGRARRHMSGKEMRKLRLIINFMSSCYPWPRFIAVPVSFAVRWLVCGVAMLTRILRSIDILKGSRFVLPTLSSAETWATKNTSLAAMTFLLACTSRGLSTCPMEGFDAGGVRKALDIPRGRYSIPLIVCVGKPHEIRDEADDTGMSHGSMTSPRYPLKDIVFENSFGAQFSAGHC